MKKVTFEELKNIVSSSKETIHFHKNMVFFGYDYYISNNVVFEANHPVLTLNKDQNSEIFKKLKFKSAEQRLQKTR